MKDKVGQIKTGLLADFILVKGDPTKDLTVLQEKENIVFVMQGGEILKDCR